MNTKMNIKIGIIGKANSGKSSVANLLVCHRNFQKVSLADPLKRFCLDVFDWKDEVAFGSSSLRDEEDPRYPLVCCPFCGIKECSKHSYPKNLSMRIAAQTLGTEWGRRLHNDIWVEYLLKEIENEQKNIVVDDIRFENEVRLLRENGFRFIFVRRKNNDHEKSNHASENNIENLFGKASKQDLIIDNNIEFKSKEEFEQQMLKKFLEWN